MAITNRGKYLLLSYVFNGATIPTNFYMALVDNSVVPTVDTNTLSELSEVPSGNGYTSGGEALSPNATDFPSLTEDDTGDQASVGIKDVVWTASGGTLPASGTGARYAVLLTDETTVGDRQVIAYFDLGSDRQVSDTQTLTLTGAELQATEPA